MSDLVYLCIGLVGFVACRELDWNVVIVVEVGGLRGVGNVEIVGV